MALLVAIRGVLVLLRRTSLAAAVVPDDLGFPGGLALDGLWLARVRARAPGCVHCPRRDRRHRAERYLGLLCVRLRLLCVCLGLLSAFHLFSGQRRGLKPTIVRPIVQVIRKVFSFFDFSNKEAI